MAELTSVEERLTAVERAVRELQERLDVISGKTDWLKRCRGALADYPEFEDVIRYGREFRESDRPDPDNETDQ